MSKKLATLFITGLMAISFTACSGQTPVPNTPPPANQPTPAAPADTNDTNQTTVYMIKLEDDGKTANSIKVGCGDSAVPVATTVGYQYNKTDAVASINAALIALQGTTADQFKAQGLQNTAAGSAWTIQKVEKPATATDAYLVHLNGKFTFGGACDMPRVRAQIEETIKKAALGNKTTIVWNGDAAAWDKAFSAQ